MRTIGIISVGRSDYSILKPLMAAIVKERGLQLYLMVTGAHLLATYGNTYKEIEKDGFEIKEKVICTTSPNTPYGCSKTMGLCMCGFANVYRKQKLDMIIVLGDRFEVLAATLAAVPFNIPIAHIAGGDITEGANDDALRHAITKLAHLHFPTNKEYAQRLLQMGEESWRVKTVGALQIDSIHNTKRMSKKDFLCAFNLDVKKKTLLVTFHPVTRELNKTKVYIRNLLHVLNALDENIIITYPNSDPASAIIIEEVKRCVCRKPNMQFVKNMGLVAYYSALEHVDVMVGNSSSGIVETGIFKLPVVNIGDRQKGRTCDMNVIHVAPTRIAIAAGVRKALSKSFNNKLAKLKSVYGRGNATNRIVMQIKKLSLNERLIKKKFIERAM